MFFSDSPVVGCSKCILIDFYAYKTVSYNFNKYLVVAEEREMNYHRNTKNAKKWISPNAFRKKFGYFFDRRSALKDPSSLRQKIVEWFTFPLINEERQRSSLLKSKIGAKLCAKIGGRFAHRTEEWINENKRRQLERYEEYRKILIRDFFLYDLYYWLLLYERFFSSKRTEVEINKPSNS
jgi:hypothetical protein